MINILIRTSARPNCFKRCVESIGSQTYSNYRIIVGNDNNDDYCSEFNPVHYKRIEPKEKHLIGLARNFPYNSYLNNMFKEVKEGWVLIIDDDDEFVDRNSLEIIAKNRINSDCFVLWNVDINGRIVPRVHGRPKQKDISMIGFCFHSKYLPLIHVTPYKLADFRIAHLLYEICKPIWINKTLTKTQGREGMGERIDH